MIEQLDVDMMRYDLVGDAYTSRCDLDTFYTS